MGYGYRLFSCSVMVFKLVFLLMIISFLCKRKKNKVVGFVFGIIYWIMLGGGKFHGPVEENRAQCDNNRLAELQLIGHVPFQSGGATAIGIGNYASLPIKRIREEDPPVNMPPQKLGVPLNNNIYQDKQGHIGARLNPNPVPTGLRLFVDKKEGGSSVNSTYENMKSTLPGVLSIGESNTVKREIDRQSEELCQFIKHQEDNILKGGRELNLRHTISLFNALESAANKKMCEKELQLENINCKNKELEDRIKQVTMEARSWHNRAKYTESVANFLKSNIQQIMAQGSVQGREGFGDSSDVEDAVSLMNHHRPEIIGECGNQELQNQERLRCKACKNRQVSVLLFPCRHLCLCADCEGLVDVCPICQATKTASFLVCM